MTPLRLRRARPEDSRLLWSWRNAPDVRATAFTVDPIPWERHELWLAAKLDDPNTVIFVAEAADGRPVGQIRFEVDGTIAEVAVVLDGAVRGQGLGSELIRLGTDALFKEKAVDGVVALVKMGNVASVRAFGRAGYEADGSIEVHGVPALRFRRTRLEYARPRSPPDG